MLSYFLPTNSVKKLNVNDHPFFEYANNEMFNTLDTFHTTPQMTQFEFKENKDHATLKAKLPEDLSRDNIHIFVDKDAKSRKWLHVHVSKQEESGDKEGKSFRKSFSKVEKAYVVDEEKYDIAKMKASFKNQILQITLPKKLSHVEDPYKIEIAIHDEKKDEN